MIIAQEAVEYKFETVMEGITYAFESVDTLCRSLKCIQDAKRRGGSGTVLNYATIVRESYARQYSIKGVLAEPEIVNESTNLIFAMEAEEEKTKGIISRIIDAIVNAFKWLWEKLKGLFGGEKSPGDVEKENQELKSKVEEAVKAGLNKEEIKNKKLAPAFSSDGQVSLSELTNRLKDHRVYLDQLSGLIEGMGEDMKKLDAALSLVSASEVDAEKVRESLKTFVDAAIKTLHENVKDTYKQNEHEKFKLVEEGNKYDSTKSRVLGPIITSKGEMLIGFGVLAPVENHLQLITAKTGVATREAVETLNVSDMDNASSVLSYMESVMELRKLQSIVFDRMKAVNSRNEGQQNALNSKLESLTGKLASNPQANHAFNGVSRQISSAGSVIRTAAQGLDAVKKTTGLSWELLNTIAKLKNAEEKEEKKDDKEEG